jgi:hypothetical protein
VSKGLQVRSLTHPSSLSSIQRSFTPMASQGGGRRRRPVLQYKYERAPSVRGQLSACRGCRSEGNLINWRSCLFSTGSSITRTVHTVMSFCDRIVCNTGTWLHVRLAQVVRIIRPRRALGKGTFVAT